MRYWVYGVDGISREPREPLFIEAADEADARGQAHELGMAAEEIELVQPKTTAADTPGAAIAPSHHAATECTPSDFPVAHALVSVFRVLAGLAAFLYLGLFFLTVDAASKAEEAARRLGKTVEVAVGAGLLRIVIEAILVVALLLAVAELLRLGMALERNTRGLAERKRHR